MNYVTNLDAKRDFLLKQRFTLTVNRFDYFLYDNGVQGDEVAFVEQKRFTLREKITVFNTQAKSDVFFSIEAEKVLDVHGKFFIRTADGQVIGYCRKLFAASLLRSTWEVYSPDDTLLLTVQEKNEAVAVLRRFGGFIPILGDILSLLSFGFIFMKDGKVVGYHKRVWSSLKDTYHLHVDESVDNVDRRVVLGLGILLDVLQAR